MSAWRSLLLFLCLVGPFARASEETLAFGRFGTITVYRATPQPAQVASPSPWPGSLPLVNRGGRW